MVKVVFIEKDGNRKEIDALPGQTVLELAHEHALDVEGACGGSLACSTCHVIVDKSWYNKLPEPDEDEQDMLDLAYGLTKTSRLGCQIEINEDLDGIVLALPKEVRNLMEG